jgi:Protein of unknown function (DUF664)
MIEDLFDPPRTEPSFLLGERAMLEGWLEFHRTTLLLKCEGLSEPQRKHQPIPTSRLSLHGLVRHAAEGERIWFQHNLLNIQDAPSLWADPTIEDREFAPLQDADWATDPATWQAECEHSRRAALSRELDDMGVASRGPTHSASRQPGLGRDLHR